MSLKGRLVSQIEIKSDGHLFHELVTYKAHHLANQFPDIVQSVVLLKGAWGTVGSVLLWNYTHDGKKRVGKEIIEAIDPNTKSVTYKVIEGDLMELYKSFSITVKVDHHHGEKSLVSWTFDYVKQNASIPDPNTLMDLAVIFTKGIDAHLLKQ